MKILILGAGGFIGSHLVEHLGATGRHEIVGLDVSPAKLDEIEPQNFRFEHRNINDVRPEEVADYDAVIDLIAYANPSIYVSDPLEVFKLNFLANLDVVDACVQHNVRLIQYSTSEVYGKSRETIYHEDTTDLVMGPVTRQRWIYAAGKQLLERVLHAHGLKGDLSYSILRPFNFIGPRFDYLVPSGTMGGPRVFAHFLSALLEGGPMYLVNGGHVHRTFLSIIDANRALEVILENEDSARNQIFNVGNPSNNTTIRGLAELMIDVYEEVTGKHPDVELVEVSGEQFYGAGYEDMDRAPPDVTKLAALGWEPTADLRTVFRSAMSAYLT